MMNRTCDNCGKPYFRRNLVVGWVAANPGHRYGWSRIAVRSCTRCTSEGQAQRMVSLVTVRRVVGGAAKERRQSA